MGHSSNQVPETPEERELARIASERWQDYQQKFIPMENKLFGRVEDLSKSEQLPSLASIDTQMQFSKGQQNLTSGMTERGMRAGSGGFGMRLGSYNIDRAASSGLGQANAYGLRTSQYLNNLQSEISMGQGKANAGISGLSDVAQLAQRRATIDAQAAIAARGAVGEGIGTFAGMYYGNMINRNPNTQSPTVPPAARDYSYSPSPTTSQEQSYVPALVND